MDPINISPILAYIPYMDPMGYIYIYLHTHTQFFFKAFGWCFLIRHDLATNDFPLGGRTCALNQGSNVYLFYCFRINFRNATMTYTLTRSESVHICSFWEYLLGGYCRADGMLIMLIMLIQNPHLLVECEGKPNDVDESKPSIE